MVDHATEDLNRYMAKLAYEERMWETFYEEAEEEIEKLREIVKKIKLIAAEYDVELEDKDLLEFL
jgi:uncharacterized protein YaaN involved in tellurite resistance